MDTENLLNAPDSSLDALNNQNDYLDDALSNLFDDEPDNANSEQDEQNTDNPATDDKAADKTDETETDNQAADGDNTDEKETVILAKDGKHTIPYEKLLEARNAEKAAKAELATLKAELDALRQGEKSNQATDETETVDDDLNNDEEVFMSKKDLNKFLNDAVAKQVNERLKIIEQQQAISVAEKHYQAIYAAHPDADSIVESKELQVWIETLPNYVQNSVKDILKHGTSNEVIDMLNDFKKWQQPQVEKQKITEIAKAKIDKVQANLTPNTLSDLPNTKSSGGKSPEEVFNNLSTADSVAFLASKSPDEMLEYIFN
ncbi:MAG: hypothetical protein IKI11_09330 [Neisseriaceae bacterium]|nr:hypothetical protein [Neisseriaceae bacterium]